MSNICTDIQATLSTYLDAELDNADLREFESHVADCAPCQQTLELAERSHSALQTHLRDTPKASDLFRKRLGNALDQEDKVLERKRRKEWFAWSLPAAASALAVAALTLFIWTDLNAPSAATAQTSQVTRDAARQHLFEKPLMVGTDHTTVGRNATKYLNQPVQAPRFSSTKVRLLGWMPTQLAGKQSATFVYEVTDRKGRHQVNVHAVKRSEIDLSSQTAIDLDGGAQLSVDRALGFTTVTYAGPQPLAYVFSSDMSAEALLKLVTNADVANMLTRPASR